MVLLSILLGVISMFGYATANVLSQPLAKTYGTPQILFLRGFTVSILLAIASIPALMHSHRALVMVLTLLLGIVGYLPLLAFTHALKISKVGLVAPIAGTSPLITVLLAFLVLHSPLKILQWFAIVVLVLANTATSVNLKGLKKGKTAVTTSGVSFALLAALGWGIFFFVLIYPTKSLGPWLSAFLVELGVTIAAGLHVLVSKQSVTLKDAASKQIIGNGLGIAIGTAAFTYGASHYDASIIAGLSNSTALIALAMAAILFKERLTRNESIGAAVMIGAVILLSV